VPEGTTPRAVERARAGAIARRRLRVVCGTLLVGGVLLDVTLRVSRTSAWFTALGLLLAGVWTAGAFLSGGVPVFPRPWRRPAQSLVAAVVVGGLAFLVFLVVYLLVRHLPLVSGALHHVLSNGDAGVSPTVLSVAIVTGIAEELFFRGAVQSLPTRYDPVIFTTVVYVAVTAVTGNVALIIAAAIMGTIFSLERAATRGVVASITTHITWTVLMLLVLPR
jgi:hypothetical protein